jgi:ABC-type methionine transport system permease subunit
MNRYRSGFLQEARPAVVFARPCPYVQAVIVFHAHARVLPAAGSGDIAIDKKYISDNVSVLLKVIKK